MHTDLKNILWEWARMYHHSAFIASDPVQFPHRYSQKADIEISGLLTAVLSFGNRAQILKKADEMDRMMGHRPKEYVLSRQWANDFRALDSRSFYRMLSYSDIRICFEKLFEAYDSGCSLEDAVSVFPGNPMQKLCAFWKVSDRSPQKKLNMFLRWMIRQNSEVDFGIWKSMSPSELIIPLDTHVCRVAYHLGLTDKATFSLNNARKITRTLSDVFPGDPCLGDFALFGYGVTHQNL